MKIKDVTAIFPDATNEQIQLMLDAVHGENDSLRRQLDKAQKDADPEGWRNKHDTLKAEYEKYKSDQEKKASDESKRTALRDLIKDSFSERGIAKVLRYADLDEIELTDKGAIKDASKLLASMKEEWSDFVTTTETQGSETHGRDGAGSAGGNGAGGAKMTRADIMKISDVAERQKAIMDNPDVFR